jgi:hypothetical protein
MLDKTPTSPKDVDWTTYDRISPTFIQTKEGPLIPFKGVVIGRRKFVGILDYTLVPLVGGALISLFPLYGYKVVNAIQPAWLASVVFYLCIILGIALAGFLFWYIFTAKRTNDRDGTANVYLNFETRELGIKNFDGKGRIIPLDTIVKVSAFRFTSLEVGPIGLKFYGRLILTVMKDGKKTSRDRPFCR